MAFSDFVKSVKNETGDAIEITKLKSKISKEKTNIKDCYEKIGELVYEKYKAQGSAEDSLMDCLRKIDSSRAAIDGYNKEISRIKMN